MKKTEIQKSNIKQKIFLTIYTTALILLLGLLAWKCQLGMRLWSRLLFCLSIFIPVMYISMSKKISLWIKLISVIILWLFILLQVLEFSAFFTMQESFNEAFYMTVKVALEDLNVFWDDGKHFLTEILTVTLALFGGITAHILFCRKSNAFFAGKYRYCSLGVFCIAVICGFFYDTPIENGLKMLKDIAGGGAEIEEISESEFIRLGLKRSSITKETLITSKLRKNLVFIILESFDRNYLDQQLFPDLTPQLSALSNAPDTLDFTNLKSTASNTTFSMFECWWGIPSHSLFFSTNEDISITGAGAGATNANSINKYLSLPQIYQKAGGTWSHIQTSGMWQAMRALIDTSNISTSWQKELRIPDPAPEMCDEWARDYTLFRNAYDLYCQKTEQGTPFALSVSTIDGHVPNGRVGRESLTYSSAPADFPKNYLQMLNAVHTTDNAVGNFIRMLKKNPAWKDTVVVVMSDHLCFDNLNQYLSKKDRKMLFMIINSGFNGKNDNLGYTFDIAPTVLHSLGLTSNYQFPAGEDLINAKDIHPERGQLASKEGKKILGKFLLSNFKNTENCFAEVKSNDNGNLFLVIKGVSFPVSYYSPRVPREDNLMYLNLDQTNFNQNKYFLNFDSKEVERIESNSGINVVFCHTDSQWFKRFYSSSEIPKNALYALGVSAAPKEWKWSLAPSPTLLKMPRSGENGSQLFLGTDSISCDDPQLFYPCVPKHISSREFSFTKRVETLPHSMRFYPTAESKSFFIDCELKNEGSKYAAIYFTMRLFNKKGQLIPCGENFPLKNTDATFASFVRADEKEIVLQGDILQYEEFLKRYPVCLVLNTQADYSDLPNRNIVKERPYAVKKINSNQFCLYFHKPIGINVAQGTSCRLHFASEYYKNNGVVPGISRKVHDELPIEMLYCNKNIGWISLWISIHPDPKEKDGIDVRIKNFSFGIQNKRQ